MIDNPRYDGNEEDCAITEETLAFLIGTHEKANVKILKHHLKDIDTSIEKIENGLLEMIYTIDLLLEQYEEGKIFKEDCRSAVDKLFVISEFVCKMESEFSSLKEAKRRL